MRPIYCRFSILLCCRPAAITEAAPACEILQDDSLNNSHHWEDLNPEPKEHQVDTLTARTSSDDVDCVDFDIADELAIVACVKNWQRDHRKSTKVGLHVLYMYIRG